MFLSQVFGTLSFFYCDVKNWREAQYMPYLFFPIQFYFCTVTCLQWKGWREHWQVVSTEAKDCRESGPTRRPALPIPGRERWRCDDFTVMGTGQAIRPAMTYCTACPAEGLLSLRVSGNPSCCCWYIIETIHKTPKWPKSRKESRCGQYSM